MKKKIINIQKYFKTPFTIKKNRKYWWKIKSKWGKVFKCLKLEQKIIIKQVIL